MKNHQWVLNAHPPGTGPVPPDTWRLVESEMPRPGSRQILVKTEWLSLDPYMRSRISPGGNYAAGVKPGEVMQGGGVGRVIESNHPDWQVGDIAETMNYGWQEHAVVTPDLPGIARANKVDPTVAPPQAHLSWYGMPGLTAYIGMLEMGRPKPGDTVVVSAASGAVGQIVGQIAKLCGARAVAIASSDDKLAFCQSLGYDALINYRTANDLNAAIAAACPKGVDVFFDNTGGPIHDAVLLNLAIAARVIICGRIAVAGKGPAEDLGIRASSRLIVTRASIHGLLVFDWWHRREEGLGRLAQWHRAGKLTYKEDVLDGFEQMPTAFARMMSGQNFGKQLVRMVE